MCCIKIIDLLYKDHTVSVWHYHNSEKIPMSMNNDMPALVGLLRSEILLTALIKKCYNPLGRCSHMYTCCNAKDRSVRFTRANA